MIDWENLARRLGAILPSTDPSVSMQHGSSVLARRALEELVDGAEWAAAVDHYVDRRPGSELARSVLWLVHPWAAMARCRDIAQTSNDPAARRFAVELLRVVADDRALPWIGQFLRDGDPLVELCAAKTVEQLLYDCLVEVEACSRLLDEMENHVNPAVRTVWAEIRSSDDEATDDP